MIIDDFSRKMLNDVVILTSEEGREMGLEIQELGNGNIKALSMIVSQLGPNHSHWCRFHTQTPVLSYRRIFSSPLQTSLLLLYTYVCAITIWVPSAF